MIVASIFVFVSVEAVDEMYGDTRWKVKYSKMAGRDGIGNKSSEKRERPTKSQEEGIEIEARFHAALSLFTLIRFDITKNKHLSHIHISITFDAHRRKRKRFSSRNITVLLKKATTTTGQAEFFLLIRTITVAFVRTMLSGRSGSVARAKANIKIVFQLVSTGKSEKRLFLAKYIRNRRKQLIRVINETPCIFISMVEQIYFFHFDYKYFNGKLGAFECHLE